MYHTKASEKPKYYLHHHQSNQDPIRRRIDDYRYNRACSSSSSPELSPEELGSGFSDRKFSGRSSVVCSVCGKKYKHHSCLQKHMWEHHEAWDACLKYNLTKHQQVQMMEAAQVLINMMATQVSR